MFRLGVENLRRLKHVEPVSLKRINILVGRNSSGKSTFLRLLPLLRQSVNNRLRSPVLWYGEDVDFGSFDGAVHRNESERSIVLKFGFDDLRTSQVWMQEQATSFMLPSIQAGEVTITVNISKDKDVSFVSYVSLQTPDTLPLSITLGADGSFATITIGGKDVAPILSEIVGRAHGGNVIPNISFSARRSNIGLNDAYFISQDTPPLFNKLSDLLSRYGRRNQNRDAIARLARSFLGCWPATRSNIAQTVGKMDLVAWKKMADEIREGQHGQFVSEAQELLVCLNSFKILAAARERIRSFASEVMYIGPVRARSDRFYRIQDLSVSQIDADGKNFPMFLNSLSESQLNSFSRWVDSLYQYGVTVGRPSGHIVIELIASGSRTNIVDTGYGVSQILPVLGQLWWARNRPNTIVPSSRVPASGQTRSPDRFVAIEQPELHLHPAHQALLADALVEPPETGTRSSRRGRNPICYIIETHSEALVNRLGEMVASKRLQASDVQILLFERDPEDDAATRVRSVPFDDDGTLLEWPYGFFIPDA